MRIKSKKRVADHEEVFTPAWMVEAMLDLVKGETERIDSRFLDPACGSGNFLTHVLRHKLAAVELGGALHVTMSLPKNHFLSISSAKFSVTTKTSASH